MNEEEMFRVNDLDGNEVIMDVTAGENVEKSTKVAEKEDKVQAKSDADMELAQKLETKEQEQLTDAEKQDSGGKVKEKSSRVTEGNSKRVGDELQQENAKNVINLPVNGRMIDNIDQDKEIALVDETQGRMNEEEMFRVNDLDGNKAKDKGKGIMVEPEKPLKKKDQITFDKEVARKHKAKMKAEIEKEERIEGRKMKQT
nr:hypothetical protein [Tanacetum cinerariifolium]